MAAGRTESDWDEKPHGQKEEESRFTCRVGGHGRGEWHKGLRQGRGIYRTKVCLVGKHT